MNQILSLDAANQIARVQAGVINIDLDTPLKNTVWHICLIQQAANGQLLVEMLQLMPAACAALSMALPQPMYVRCKLYWQLVKSLN
jgi:hypothetical protein